MMWFVLLGTVGAIVNNQTIQISRAQRRAVLAYLLLHANQTVTASELVDALWGGAEPATARAQVFASVSAVRGALRANGFHSIDSVAGGYRLEVSSDQLDLEQFREQVARSARRAHESPQDAADGLRSALKLWQGEPLGGVTAAFVEPARVHLKELRLTAQERLYEVELALGRHREVTAELAELVSAHPLRESLAGQLMLASYRNGQQAEALATFRRTREILVEELGIDPGTELRLLHKRILDNDPELAAPAAPAPAAAPRPHRFLPHDIPDFVGRESDLDQLSALTEAGPGAAEIMLVSAIAGTGGIGKTALAVRWAHRSADRFPDGQLYVNLRGYDQGAPLSPLEALIYLLRCLGVDAEKLPGDLDSAAATYRSMLTAKRMLILLDNARSADQVRPLLPGPSPCVVVVTSRDKLSGLIATEGARRITLGTLRREEALTLLRRLVGDARARSEWDAIEKLVRLCGGLPLALRIAAAQIADRPDDSIEQYVKELTECDRPTALALDGDEHRGLGAILDQSYRTLSAEQQTAFRLLSLFPGPYLSAEPAAAILGCPASEALSTLDGLASCHLLEQPHPAGFVFHDLVREYARSAFDRSGEAMQEPLRRMFDYYQQAAAEAHARMDPNRFGSEDGTSQTWTTQQAMAWVDGERANLAAVMRSAAAQGLREYTIALARPLFWFFFYAGYTSDSVATFESVHDVIDSENVNLKHSILDTLGAAYVRAGQYEKAIRAHRKCIDVWVALGEDINQAKSRSNLAMSYTRLGRYEEAYEQLSGALKVYQARGDQAMQAQLLGYNIPNLLSFMGRHLEAIEHIHRGIEILQHQDNKFAMARTLEGLGQTYVAMGAPREAGPHLERALGLAREVGDRRLEAVILGGLGSMHRELDQYDLALELKTRALEFHRQSGVRANECQAHNEIAKTYAAAGDTDRAKAAFSVALTLADELGLEHERARALAGLGMLGVNQAENLLTALNILDRLSPAEAQETRKRLAVDGDQG